MCAITTGRRAAARHDDVYRQTTTVCRSTAAARAPGLNKVYYYSHTRTRARARSPPPTPYSDKAPQKKKHTVRGAAAAADRTILYTIL